jgi:predicted  nucleic acid-binding Zn-ribbon protein
MSGINIEVWVMVFTVIGMGVGSLITGFMMLRKSKNELQVKKEDIKASKEFKLMEILQKDCGDLRDDLAEMRKQIYDLSKENIELRKRLNQLEREARELVALKEAFEKAAEKLNDIFQWFHRYNNDKSEHHLQAMLEVIESAANSK